MTKAVNGSRALIALTICAAASLSQFPSLGKAISLRSTHRGVQPASSAGPISASSVTGSYERDFHREYSGNLEVQEMSGGRIKFQLSLLGELSNPGGPNMGETDGVVRLHTVHHQTTAVYQADGSKITMRFHGNKVVVSQYGELGYGLGVNADGTYMRKSRNPDFDSSMNQ